MALPDFIRDALARAPMADLDEIDPEELAEVERLAAEGSEVRGVPHAEVQRMIAEMRPLAG